MMDHIIKLLPCPFCGSDAKFKKRGGIGDYDWDKTYYDVMCINVKCYLQDGADWCYDSEEEAAEIWNRREIVK